MSSIWNFYCEVPSLADPASGSKNVLSVARLRFKLGLLPSPSGSRLRLEFQSAFLPIGRSFFFAFLVSSQAMNFSLRNQIEDMP
jgi:hypothetical protein